MVSKKKGFQPFLFGCCLIITQAACSFEAEVGINASVHAGAELNPNGARTGTTTIHKEKGSVTRVESPDNLYPNGLYKHISCDFDASSERFAGILERVRKDFEGNRLQTAKKSVNELCITAPQAAELLDMLTQAFQKVEFAKFVKTRVRDKEAYTRIIIPKFEDPEVQKTLANFQPS